jgi:exonuclease VII large subunit
VGGEPIRRSSVGQVEDGFGLAKIIVSIGPHFTLRRGFAIVRDDQDKPLTSREAAMNHATFQVQFRDGKVAVTKNERSEGDEQ